jgi:predicted TIM-barrel fold metal-dependent hydrolase
MERCPNFAVDTSARLPDLAFQDAGVVRAFFRDHADRILFGTDIVCLKPHNRMTTEERSSLLRQASQNYQRQRAFFAGTDPIEIGGRTIPGLGLPADILEQFFSANARTWYPGL